MNETSHQTQSAYPAFAMGGLCIAGGVAGFARTRSVPSLVAGVGVGAVYLWVGDRIRRGEDNGLEGAVAASTLTLASTASRLLRTRTLAPGPIRARVPVSKTRRIPRRRPSFPHLGHAARPHPRPTTPHPHPHSACRAPRNIGPFAMRCACAASRRIWRATSSGRGDGACRLRVRLEAQMQC
ncbi:transmembrane proteins 14C-domain-containing protein [Mycena crocata]|nr:transmembrane proteins 14C-domain-containing protein [Mycena crocata]